ncbi:PREDICTED: cytochrome c oxidase assembly factor 5-like [Amphimedon queenslandica]|uniref:Cytochrome c oxidase assembly factor 5 n=1 Tax=Amphimedon queenslandica TaxID=400682 RepID=A0A1X7UCA8_AMPQE|nr:PREDICTED: cytochrome c oxidase assembly factor 5-like [Amphimedon queenslandica]|eukprot:XP_011405463.1 PREDICTED: cytochrome c oxidase assembly factor 5-like [Amphimedon queenslandica]
MSAVDEELENKPVRPCTGLRTELLKCLKESECFTKHGLTPRQCLDSTSPGYDPSCQSLVVGFFECKRSLLDNRQRFRGRKGY